MIIGFTGTSKYSLTNKQIREVRQLLKQCEEVHHGDCIGADASFHELAKACGKRIVIHPPMKDNHRAYKVGDVVHPVKAYLQRNHNIVNAVDLMIACPHTDVEQLRSGTWATIRYARKVGKALEVLPRGEENA